MIFPPIFSLPSKNAWKWDTWSISDNLSLFFLHYISNQNSPTPPFPSFHSHCPLLPSLPLSLPTCCGLSLPVTRRTKSSSERVREHPGFSPTGSPGWIDPGEFFKSAAVCGVCGASCVQNCVHRHVTQSHKTKNRTVHLLRLIH